ncbi:uncharacterized protein K444DRAFT_530070, partial [Hyaloscypha bicolor E]
INNILFNYLKNFYIAYFNNILIYFNNKLEYELYIKKYFLENNLAKGFIKANIKKSEFKIIYIKYLGFIISISSIKIDPNKVKIIYN